MSVRRFAPRGAEASRSAPLALDDDASRARGTQRGAAWTRVAGCVGAALVVGALMSTASCGGGGAPAPEEMPVAHAVDETAGHARAAASGAASSTTASSITASSITVPSAAPSTTMLSAGEAELRVAAKGGFCVVEIDGRSLGDSPVTATVAPGTHTVTCTFGRRPMRQQVTVEERGSARVLFTGP